MHLPQFGQYQVQIFISLTLVMGGLLVALICDYLKGNNEQLREQNVALRIQRAEERRRSIAERTRTAQMIALRQHAVNPASGELVITSGERAAAPMEMVTAAAEPAIPAPAQAVAVATGRVRASRSNGASRRPISADAMAVMQRGAAMAASKHAAVSIAEVSTTEVSTTNVPANHALATSAASIELPAGIMHAVSAEVTTESQAEVAKAPSQVILGHKRNWSDLLAHRGQKLQTIYMPQATNDTDQPAIYVSDPSAQAGDVPVPAGFYDGYVLTRLVQSHKPVSGLVVSIGVSAAHENGEPDLQAVRTMIQSLMGPQDFAAASAPDEYLLIYPHERGAAAQRRLSEIAQQLWDFQLRTVGNASVLFSWGGVEVRGELIEDAIASASERMHDTRRSRSARSFDRQAYKMAVSA
jgi:hypothetical protein